MLNVTDDFNSQYEVQCIQNISQNNTEWNQLEAIGISVTTFPFVYAHDKTNHLDLMVYSYITGTLYHWWDNMVWTNSERTVKSESFIDLEEEEEEMDDEPMISDPEIERLLGEYVRQHTTHPGEIESEEDPEEEFLRYLYRNDFARIRREIKDPVKKEEIREKLYKVLNIDLGTYAEDDIAEDSVLQAGQRLPVTEDTKA